MRVKARVRVRLADAEAGAAVRHRRLQPGIERGDERLELHVLECLPQLRVGVRAEGREVVGDRAREEEGRLHDQGLGLGLGLGFRVRV